VSNPLNDPDAGAAPPARETMPVGALALLSALPHGEPQACDGVVDGDAEPLILLRDGDQVRVWLNICPHAGRRLDWAPGRFLRSKTGELVCAVHGATFETQGGRCVAGPCVGASLRAVAVEVRDGAVWLT
jgi:nitrite reductase/ring-hydroxylating ferredoxin subunit